MAINHVLKIMIRVERGDDEFLDAKGKRKVSLSFQPCCSKQELTLLSDSDGISSWRPRYTSSRADALKIFYLPIRPRPRRFRPAEARISVLRLPIPPQSSVAHFGQRQAAVAPLPHLTITLAEEEPPLISLHLNPRVHELEELEQPRFIVPPRRITIRLQSRVSNRTCYSRD